LRRGASRQRELSVRVRSAATAPSPLAGHFASRKLQPPNTREKILTSKVPSKGNGKQVTVLFADLKGSMELLATGSEEPARSSIPARAHDGRRPPVLGNGEPGDGRRDHGPLRGPARHEDHAVRACYARPPDAGAGRPLRGRGLPLPRHPVRIRVGLNSARSWSAPSGPISTWITPPVGQTTHLAARMEQLADPATTLLTPDTLRLAEGYVQVKPGGPSR